ncbi:MAG: histone deacetylase family protein [Actinomycetota bacterium]
MRVVFTDAHRAHDPDLASFYGRLAPVVEVPARADSIHDAIARDDAFSFIAPSEHGTEPITAVHDPGLVAFLEEAWDAWQADPAAHEIPRIIPEMFLHPAVTEGMDAPPPQASVFGSQAVWTFDASTPLVAGTYLAARAAVDVALTTADLVLGGETAAYGVCRPPGHHAARAAFGGFCYLNNAAIAAEHVVRASGDQVAILDVDYHHGNGTQQVFYARGDVLYASLHADPARAYPYLTGYAGEVGTGQGLGATMNVPLPEGTADAAYLAALEPALARIAALPGSILVVSLGFDTYERDPICDLALTTEGYHRIGARVAETGKRLVLLQEGGYHVADLGANARAWLRGAAGLPLT